MEEKVICQCQRNEFCLRANRHRGFCKIFNYGKETKKKISFFQENNLHIAGRSSIMKNKAMKSRMRIRRYRQRMVDAKKNP